MALYDSRRSTGRGPWQRFFRITLPFIAPTIAITVMLRTIWIATFADLIFVMTQGGPAGATNTIATYVYVTAFGSLDKGYASTLAVLLLVLLILYAFALIRLRRAFGWRGNVMAPVKTAFRAGLLRAGFYGAIACYVAFALFPLFWTLKISVTPTRLLYSQGITVWPSVTTLHNYIEILTTTAFPRYFMNSVIVSVATSAAVVVLASGGGYALFRFRFRGRKRSSPSCCC